jgi:hypothetical protein
MGGVAFLYPWNVSDAKKKVLEISGLLLILGSYAFVSSDTPWPGHFALIPVLGSYLMIVANRQSSVITNNKVFQYLGKWSYSIYLWHWPIVVFGYYFDIQDWYLYGLPLSVALGFASFRFIEGLKFHSFSRWFDVLQVKPVYMFLIVGFIGVFTFVTNGFVNRVGSDVLDLTYFKDYNGRLIFSEVGVSNQGCNLYDMDERCNRLSEKNSDIEAIILGDSHAGAGFLGVYESYLSSGGSKKIVSAGAPGCLPVLNMNHRDKGRDGCKWYMSNVYHDIEKYYQGVPIVILSRFNLYPFGFNENGEKNNPYMFLTERTFNDKYAVEFKKNMIDSFCKLTLNNDVYILRPLPEFKKNTPNIIVKGDMLGVENNINISNFEYENRSNFINRTLDIVAEKCGAHLIDVSNEFKKGDYFYANKGNLPYFVDDNHLSIFGAKLISKHFDHIWN